VITRPQWISQPSPEQMARHYPERALEREIQGRAVLQCRVTASGQVTACTVAGQTPANAGFGEAALKVSRYFRMSPQTEDGRPVEGAEVRVAVMFRLGD
jgi:protein TonB